jgi:hypothetical protein
MTLHRRRSAARAALVVVLLAPASATHGQTLSTSESADLDRIINIAECEGRSAALLAALAAAALRAGSRTRA